MEKQLAQAINTKPSDEERVRHVKCLEFEPQQQHRHKAMVAENRQTKKTFDTEIERQIQLSPRQDPQKMKHQERAALPEIPHEEIPEFFTPPMIPKTDTQLRVEALQMQSSQKAEAMMNDLLRQDTKSRGNIARVYEGRQKAVSEQLLYLKERQVKARANIGILRHQEQERIAQIQAKIDAKMARAEEVVSTRRSKTPGTNIYYKETVQKLNEAEAIRATMKEETQQLKQDLRAKWAVQRDGSTTQTRSHPDQLFIKALIRSKSTVECSAFKKGILPALKPYTPQKAPYEDEELARNRILRQIRTNQMLSSLERAVRHEHGID